MEWLSIRFRFVVMLFRLLYSFVVMCGRQIFSAIFTKVHKCGAMCKDIFTVKVVNHPRSLQCKKLSLALWPTCLLKKWLLLFTSDHHLLYPSHEDASVHDGKKPDDVIYPFEDGSFMFLRFMFNALGLLTNVKLDKATSYAWPWNDVCINVNTFFL